MLFGVLINLPWAFVLNPPIFLSGGLACSLSHTISVPVDVVKTRQQSDPARYSDGALACAVRIVRDEGPAVLLLGGGSTLFGYFLQGSLKYGLYDAFKPEITSLLPTAPRLATLLLAGVAAESIASLVLCPLEALRIRSVCDPSSSSKPFFAALGEVLQSPDGYAGLVPIWLKMCPYTALQLSTYEIARGVAEQSWPGGGGFAGQLGCAAVAACVASLGSQPGDALLSASNQRTEQGGAARPNVLQLAAELGPQGLFRGTGARLLQMLIIVVVQLLANDQLRELCGAQAVGH